MDPRLHLVTGSLVFHYFFWESLDNTNAKLVGAMGVMATWFVYKHAMEAMDLARALGVE